MMMMIRSCKWLVASLIFLASVPAGATNPLFQSDAGWVLQSFSQTESSLIQATLESEGPAALSLRILDMDGHSIVGWTMTRTGGGQFLSIDTARSDSVAFGPTGGSEGRADLSGGLSFANFQGYLLVSVMGDDATAGWRVDQPAGGTVATIATGADWYFSRGAWMESKAHAILQANGAYVALQREGRMDLDLSGRFIGLIGHTGAGSGQQEVSIEMSGMEQQCPCIFANMSGPSSVGNGTLSIRRDAALIERDFPTIVVAGVDVPWPPPTS